MAGYYHEERTSGATMFKVSIKSSQCHIHSWLTSNQGFSGQECSDGS